MTDVYNIEINEDDDLTGVDFVALVKTPATGRKFVALSEVKPIYLANEEEQTVTGVMLEPGKKIARHDKELGNYFIVYQSDAIKKIARKFMKNLNLHNVNIEHAPNLTVEGVYLTESYVISKGMEPEVLKGQNLPLGTWVTTYKVENPEIWAQVKQGTFLGFSIEGAFIHKKVKQTKTIKTIKPMNVRQLLFGTPKKVALGTLETVDGVVLTYEGEELEVGVQIYATTDEAQTVAPEGKHDLTDGRSIILDANGILLEIVEAGEPSTENVAEVIDAIVEEMKAQKQELAAVKDELKATKVELAAVKKAPVEAPKTVKQSNASSYITKDANPLIAKYLNK
jgi:hypothetical protein